MDVKRMNLSNNRLAYIREKVIEASHTYQEQLAGKVYLYVIGEEYFEVNFRVDCFLHLTGVKTSLKAKQFYKKATSSTITTDQIQFHQMQDYHNAKKKLSCLNDLPCLTNNMVCVVKELETLKMVYKIGVTNISFTLGLIENTNPNYKLNNWLVPCTLRVKDKAIENSESANFVDFIFEKDASCNKYSTLKYADSKKDIPQNIYHLIDTTFYQ